MLQVIECSSVCTCGEVTDMWQLTDVRSPSVRWPLSWVLCPTGMAISHKWVAVQWMRSISCPSGATLGVWCARTAVAQLRVFSVQPQPTTRFLALLCIPIRYSNLALCWSAYWRCNCQQKADFFGNESVGIINLAFTNRGAPPRAPDPGTVLHKPRGLRRRRVHRVPARHHHGLARDWRRSDRLQHLCGRHGNGAAVSLCCGALRPTVATVLTSAPVTWSKFWGPLVPSQAAYCHSGPAHN